MSYRGRSQGVYRIRRLHRFHARRGSRTKLNTVSKEKQDRRFKEISEAFAGVPPSSHRSIRQRLAMHKLYGETH